MRSTSPTSSIARVGPEELDTAKGGGVVFSQAAHQVDIVRLLAGAKATSVRAFTGNWDAARHTEGAYSAQIEFEDGSFASLTYSGYAHFDTDEFMGWWGELGQARDGEASVRPRAAGAAEGDSVADEIALEERPRLRPVRPRRVSHRRRSLAQPFRPRRRKLRARRSAPAA